VHVILLGQPGQRLLSLDRGQRHLGLESWSMGPGVLVSSWSLLIRGILAALGQNFHLSTCPNWPATSRFSVISGQSLSQSV
jgi:hypothetical protein